MVFIWIPSFILFFCALCDFICWLNQLSSRDESSAVPSVSSWASSGFIFQILGTWTLILFDISLLALSLTEKLPAAEKAYLLLRPTNFVS